MQAHKIVKATLKIAVIGVVIAIGLSMSNTSAFAAAPETTPDLLAGITLDSSLNDTDVAYLRATLQLLSDQSPVWAQYIEGAKPFVLIVDVSEGEHGHAAVAECCDALGRGTIKFGHRFGQAGESTTIEGRQIEFIGTLVHEVTHIRDQRAGIHTTKTDRKSCVAAEKSGLDKQLEVKRALTAGNLNDGYQQTLNDQIKTEAGALKSRDLWDQYCGKFN